MPEIPAHLIHPHAEFFFPDGNLILVTGTDPTPQVAFRLHRGIVNRWSLVFRGMIDALDATADSWTYLGCGVIVLDDIPVDFERLIRALYDGNAPLDCSATTFPVLASLLRVSHKYCIPHIQDRMMTHLLAVYPLTLPAWDAREAYVFSAPTRYDRLATSPARHPHPLAVVSIALQLGIPSILIPAYLELARFPVSSIIRGYRAGPSSSAQDSIDNASTSPPPVHIPTLHLPASQTMAVLRGKETLQRFIADFIKASVENRPPSPLCRYVHLYVPDDPLATPSYPCAMAFARISHEMLVMTAGVAGGVDSDPLFVLKCAVEILEEWSQDTENITASEVVPVSDGGPNVAGPVPQSGQDVGRKNAACPACMESFRQTVDVARRHIWNCLPKWFDLKRFIENGFEAGWE